VNILKNLVNLLTLYVEDAKPVAESEILKFAQEHDIFLRDDHLLFLMKFGCEPGGRLEIFKNYEGDFDFETFRKIYLENSPDMELPEGCTYFGSSFMDGAYCIDNESGKIYAFDEGQLFGLVHESINGFLINCLLIDGYEKAFSNTEVRQSLALEVITEFRSINENGKINEATHYGEERNRPIIISEFYLIDKKLIKLFLPAGTMVTLSGGILDQLSI
jgi:hypothetical protein